jgi:hypothetical protein
VPPETSNAIDRWLRVEDETARGVVLRQEVAELNRLRREVQTELDRALATLTRQRDQAARQVTELSQVCEGLGAVPAALPDGVTSAEFRQARHVIQGVRMELLKHQRATTSAEGRPPPAFYSLSFGQLTRLGLGLTWPLLVMLLLVGLMIAFGVVLAFRV